MADKYIDNTETQTYGPELRASFQRRFGDDPRPAVRAIVAWFITQQAGADQTMADALVAHRRAKGNATVTSESTSSPVVESTHRTLSAFYKHLDAKREDDAWSGSLQTFFPDLRAGLVRGLRPLKSSLTGAISALADDDTVPERDAWLRKLRAAQRQLDTAIDGSRDAVHGARDSLSEQAVEKSAWLRQYQAGALLMESLLNLEGAQNELASLVPHLSAPSRRKPTDGAKPNVPDRPVAPVDSSSKPAPVA